MFQDNILKIADGTENIVLHRPGSDRYEEIRGVLPRKTKEQDKRRDQSLIPYQWRTWYLPTSDVPEAPQPGQEILDSQSFRWIITKIDSSELPGSLRCVARRHDAVFSLDEYVDLFRKRADTTPSGAVEYLWFLVRAGIASKFSETTVSENGTESREIAFRTPVEVHALDRLRFPDGSYWRIVNVVTPQDDRDWTELKIEKIQH